MSHSTPADEARLKAIPFSGGLIDGNRLEEGEIYIGKPKAATPPPGCEVAAKYVELIQAGQYDKIADLFTEDAVFLHSHGAPAIGRDAIRRFYTQNIKNLDVDIVGVAYAAMPGVCYVHLAIARLGKGEPVYVSAAVDQFFLAEDGRARMMLPYGRRVKALAATHAEME
jgi:hypothetical protein